MGHEYLITRRVTEAAAQVMNPYAEVHETHTGVVILLGNKAYKVKKPVATDVLDFTTPALREEACKRETELNSRLCPQSYLGVAHLSDPSGGPAEPVVVMRRYPDASRLATLILRGSPVEEELAQIATVLARFHDEADRGTHIDAQAEASTVAARWQENLFELRNIGGAAAPVELIDQVDRLATNYVSGRTGLFMQRTAEGRIVDGHGDLLAEDIFCLADGPALLDCLEFDTTSDTSTASTMPPSWRWVWSFWAAKTSPTTSSTATPASVQTTRQPR